MSPTYDESWSSLKRHRTPEWLDDAKWGIYFHWGIFSVPAFGSEWYPNRIYGVPLSREWAYHLEKYGPLDEFGYKDLIPQFTAEHFDADEWATLFKAAGAQFAGPVAEHHDGFSMWDSQVNRWNAKNMGPQRDVVGELAVAIRKQGMKFITTFHHGNLWYYYNHDPALDTGDPQYSDFYGKAHAATKGEGMSSPRFDRPDQEFCEIWFAKLKEVIDGYRPDLLWFDFDLNWIPDKYKRKMAAYYYNAAEEWGTEVEIIYKDQGPGHFHMAPGMGLLDYERGRSGKLTKYKWMTDTSLGRKSWCYIEDEEYLPTSALVHSFIDRIAKNGYLLLNFGPRADGTIPDPVQDTFREFGKWVEVNKEAIFGSTPWVIAEEGPTRLEKEGGFNDDQDYTQAYTAEDIRFTTKGNALYAFSLGWPEDTLFIRTLTAPPVGWREYPELHFYLVEESDIDSITLLGCDEALRWEITTQGLKITPPAEKPCDHAYCFKIAWS